MKHDIQKKIRIVVLGVRGIPEVQGGIERHCQELYPRLVCLGCEVVIIARKRYVPLDFHYYKGVKIIPLWSTSWKFLETIIHTAVGIFWLSFHLKQFDILHVHAIGPSFFTPFAKFIGLQVVTTNHGPDYDRRKWGWFAKNFLLLGERIGVYNSDAVIAVAEYIQKILTQKYNKKIFFIPNGAQITNQNQSNNLLKLYGLESNRYIIAVGRLVPEKGFHDLIEVFSKIKTDYKLVIVGSAIFEDCYSRNFKKKADSTDDVVLTGFLKSDELNELYSHAGLFIQTSYHEGLSLSLLEAMSYGLPILVSDISANKEIKLPAERYFKCGDKIDLLEKIKFLIGKELTIDEQKILQKQIANKYNWEKIVNETMNVYLKVMDLDEIKINKRV